MEFFVGGQVADGLAYFGQSIDSDTSVFKLAVKVGILDFLPLLGVPFLFGELMVLALIVGVLVFLVGHCLQLFDIGLRNAFS